MELAQIFETIMLLCFLFAWPFSIIKMLRTKQSQGKSILFLLVIIIGYIMGILFRLFDEGEVEKTIFLYAINGIVVSYDLYLTIKYKRLNKKIINKQ